MAIATSLSIQASQTKVLKGTLENDISGWLKRLDTQAVLGYKRIRLWRKKPSEGSLKFYYEMGNYPNGLYVFRVGDWNETGIYQFQTEFQGDAEFSACKSPVLQIECYVPTPTAIDTSLSIKADPTQGILPLEITISGKLVRKDTEAGIPYKNVYIYYQKPSVSVFSLFSLRGTESDGSYRAYPTLIEEGAYKFYCKFLGDETFKASESSIIQVQGAGEKTSSLTIELAVIPKHIGDKAHIEGKLTANGQKLGNMKYQMCQKKNGGSWSCVSDTTLADGSIIWVSLDLEKGSYEWQAKFQGYTKVFDSESVKGCLSNIVKATVAEEPVPTPDTYVPPSEATYALRCHYWNWANVSKDAIESGVHNIVVPLIATEMALAGYDYCYAEHDFHDKGYFEIYFKPRGTPALPVALIQWVLITICVAIIGITICWVAWCNLQTKAVELEEKKGKKQLLEEGLISEETYKSLMENQKEEDWLGKLTEWLPILLVIIIIIFVAGAKRD